MDNLVNIKQMANILGVRVSWLYQRTAQGQEAIPHLKLGRYVRFEPEKVIDFLKNKGQEEGK